MGKEYPWRRAWGHDKDQFDTDRTIYLMDNTGAGDRLVTAARLNPPTERHRLSDILGVFCVLMAAPCDRVIDEFSRYVSDRAALPCTALRG